MDNSLRLKHVRDSLGLNQRDMAAELKVTNGAIALWESNRRPIPGPVLRLIELYEEELGITQSTESEHDHINLASGQRGLRHLKLGSGLFVNWLAYTLEAVFTATSEKSELKKRTYLSVAKKLLTEADQMKGLPMKIGQLISFLSFTMPEEAKEILEQLQSRATPLNPKEIENVFVADLKGQPKDKFKKWTSKPFAVASIGQVHLAKLHSGDLIAVKIQFPGIRETLNEDLKNLSPFAPIFKFLINQKEPNGILAELQERLIEECDYKKEADSQQIFYSFFKDYPSIKIPKVYPEYSNNFVLSCEFSPDMSYQEFKQTATPEEKQRAAEIIWQFSFESVFRHGFLNADPHPGNYLFGDDHVTFLDYGSVKKFSPEFIAIWKKLFIDIVERNEKVSIARLLEMGVLETTDGVDEDHLIRLFNTLYGAYLTDEHYTYTPEYLTRTFNLWFRHNPNKNKMKFPKDWLYLTRALWGVSAILADLEAKATWKHLAFDIIHNRPTLPKGR